MMKIPKKLKIVENKIVFEDVSEEDYIKERLNDLKKEFIGRVFILKKWAPPKKNLNWSHDHCEICNKEIENTGYADNEEHCWLCKKCIDAYGDKLNLNIKK